MMHQQQIPQEEGNKFTGHCMGHHFLAVSQRYTKRGSTDKARANLHGGISKILRQKGHAITVGF